MSQVRTGYSEWNRKWCPAFEKAHETRTVRDVGTIGELVLTVLLAPWGLGREVMVESICGHDPAVIMGEEFFTYWHRMGDAYNPTLADVENFWKENVFPNILD